MSDNNASRTATPWISPLAHPKQHLVLPKLQLKEQLDLDHVLCAETPIHVSVSPDFLSVWATPPQDPCDAADIAKRCAVLCEGFMALMKVGQGQVIISEKCGPQDLVTEMDQGIEMLFRMWLQQHYPAHKVVGEEGTKAIISAQDWVWYIDPIDGTHNFIEGRQNVSVHLMCVHQGTPKVGVVGVPHTGKIWIAYDGMTLDNTPITYPKNPFVIGTEYLEKRWNEHDKYHALLQQTHAEPFRVKSIGCHILALQESKVTAFYKPHLKLWDAMAPLAILALCTPNLWDIALLVPDSAHKTWHEVSPFSMSDDMIDHLNQQHQQECRIGTLVLTPLGESDLKQQLVDLCKTL